MPAPDSHLPQHTVRPDGSLDLHASTVALPGSGGAPAAGVMLFGPTGSGKSELALELMALGARLVADDRTLVAPMPGGGLVASAPAVLHGLIEARGIGIMRVKALPSARLYLAVDLGKRETERLPPERSIDILGVSLPLLHAVASRAFPAALLPYLRQVSTGASP